MSAIARVCAFLHNWFETDPDTGEPRLYEGTYEISDGVLYDVTRGRSVPAFLEEGQYFRIFNSHKNDGVHQYGVDELKDETFKGSLWEMRPPDEFLAIVAEIDAWLEKYDDVMKNPYQSEDVIGVYRYTKMTQGKVTGNFIASWEQVFRNQLNEWRRVV